MANVTLTPRLVVRGADRAIEYYRRVFDAKLEERFAEEGGHVVQAVVSIGDVKLALTEERHEWNNDSPLALKGSSVILNLVVDDVDSVAQRLRDAGAEEVFPVADQFYGHREGRFRDPFGHLWIVTKILEKLSPEEIRRRMSGGG
jgi:PhnB protein